MYCTLVIDVTPMVLMKDQEEPGHHEFFSPIFQNYKHVQKHNNLCKMCLKLNFQVRTFVEANVRPITLFNRLGI